MKGILKIFLKYYLKYITKIVLFIHRPIIIAVAGSTNKPFVKQEIKRVLSGLGIDCRANPKNFNTEIGLPLSVLYLPSGFNSYKKWITAIINAPKVIFQKQFPKYLVLSLGSSDPGDMEYLLTIVNPGIVIITDITQRHLEGFDGIDGLFSEYIYLINTLKKRDILIINRDIIRFDLLVKDCLAKTITYGIDNKADYFASKLEKSAQGQDITVEYRDTVRQYKLERFGQHHVYALLIGLIIKDYARQQIIKTNQEISQSES